MSRDSGWSARPAARRSACPSRRGYDGVRRRAPLVPASQAGKSPCLGSMLLQASSPIRTKRMSARSISVRSASPGFPAIARDTRRRRAWVPAAMSAPAPGRWNRRLGDRRNARGDQRRRHDDPSRRISPPLVDQNGICKAMHKFQPISLDHVRGRAHREWRADRHPGVSGATATRRRRSPEAFPARHWGERGAVDQRWLG